MSQKKKLALSLSGGGVKALVYAGALKAFEENGIEVDIVGGLSGGSLIAGFYAMGKTPDEIIQIFTTTDILKLVDTNPFDGYEIIDHSKFLTLLEGLIDGTTFANLKKKLLIFATDLVSKKGVILRDGELASAILGSCCLPPLLNPLTRGEHVLVDGGLSTFFGVKHLKDAGAEVVIGLDSEQWNMETQFPPLLKPIIQSISVMSEIILSYEMQLFPPDLQIKGFDDSTTLFDFNKIKSGLPQKGYDKIMQHMDQIKELVF